ncbi:hypothetical protein NL108_013988 [Boleophthalmus pectinirostris]|nr:hypothetical protein NL108_013988 [Boleophthalmus pectinirostris]
MAEAAVVVSVSVQNNEQKKFRFLGVTQICLIVFHVSCIVSLPYSGRRSWSNDQQYLISSFFVLIAGCLAIAAKNLHLPTLRACLGMEILSSLACLAILNITVIKLITRYHACYHAPTSQDKLGCENLHNAHMHLFTELLLVHVALFAISVTLVVYACKNCCCPAPKVPVIMIQAPPAPQ